MKKSNSVKVSVIMPVYNVEEYLSACLDSVLSQSLKEIEVICVDDGSTDSSPAILDSYARLDPRLTVHHQANRYAGTARNLGMSKASGDYLVFWDSDDLFHKDALKKLYRQCIRHQADLAVCGAMKFDMALKRTYRDDGYLNTKLLPAKTPFSRKDIPGHIFNFTANVPWNKMYRRAFVEEKGLSFQELRQANDVFFVMNALCQAGKITVVDEPLITYRIGSGIGLTRNAGSTRFCQSQAFEATWVCLQKDPDFSGALKQSFLNKMVSSMFFLWGSLGSGEAAEELFTYYREDFFPRFGVFEQDPSYWYTDLTRQRLSVMAGGTFTDLLVHDMRYFHRLYASLASYTGVVSRMSRLHDSTAAGALRHIRKSASHRLSR